MKFSASCLLALLSLQGAVAAFKGSPLSGKAPTPRADASSLHMSMSAFETVLEFNAQFKQGLKYVLVPQSANRVVPGSYYDSASIPDLEAPREFLEATKPAASSTFAPPEFTVPDFKFVAPEFSASAASTTVPAPVNPTLEAMARDVDNALQAARDVMSSNFDEAYAYDVDPVVDRTLAQMRENLLSSHPPSFQDLIPRIAPPGQGLATPLLDYVTSTLNSARDAPPLFGSVVLPQDYETVRYGFQVKSSALDAIHEVGVTANKVGSRIHDSALASYANIAPVREQIKTVLLANVEQIQDKNAEIAATVSANSAAIAEKMVANSAALAHQISDNADALRSAAVSSALGARGFHLPAEQFAALQRSLQAVLSTPGWTLTDVVDALNLEELGGWYAGAVVGFLVLAAVNDRQSAVRAATAEIAVNAQKKQEQDEMEKQRLEGMVVELTQAVAILTAELRDLKTQRAETNYALASMQSDVRDVKVEVGKSSAAEKQLYTKLAESDAKNEVLRKQLDTARFEVAALREVNDALTAGMSALGVTQPSLHPHPPLVPPTQLSPKAEPAGNVFFANLVDKAGEETNLPVANINIKKEPTNGGLVGDDDWSKLSVTALKRKPITEIMAYLMAKGASVTGDDGRPLKKAELLETVFSSS